jgi:hypothetical protein
MLANCTARLRRAALGSLPVQAKQAEFVGNEAAYYLQTIANEYAAQGWEFYRVDTIGVVVEPGCLAFIV